jgi:hypothetical protein
VLLKSDRHNRQVGPTKQTLDVQNFVLAVSGPYWFSELRDCVFCEVGTEAEGTIEHRPSCTVDGMCPDMDCKSPCSVTVHRVRVGSM